MQYITHAHLLTSDSTYILSESMKDPRCLKYSIEAIDDCFKTNQQKSLQKRKPAWQEEKIKRETILL